MSKDFTASNDFMSDIMAAKQSSQQALCGMQATAEWRMLDKDGNPVVEAG